MLTFVSVTASYSQYKIEGVNLAYGEEIVDEKALLPNMFLSRAGFLEFKYEEDSNNIYIKRVAIGEMKFERDGEDYEMKIRGRGIANKLYEKFWRN